MESETLVKVWDLPLRIFHWLLVAGYSVAYLTEEELLPIHVWAGYLVFILLIFRLIWGFIGNDNSQFSNFLCSPVTSINYLKDLVKLKSKRHLGHNPAGSAMIVLLLISLLATVISGFAVYGADQGAGPLAMLIGSNHEELLEETHELFANFTLFLVIVHILGVIVESFVHRENLTKSMVHGSKKPEQN